MLVCWFIVREAEGRRQANDIKGGGRLDLCDKPSLNNLSAV